MAKRTRLGPAPPLLSSSSNWQRTEWTGGEKRGGSCLLLLAVAQMKILPSPSFTSRWRAVVCLRGQRSVSYRNNKELARVNHKARGGWGSSEEVQGPQSSTTLRQVIMNFDFISARVSTVIIPNADSLSLLEIWKLSPAVIRALRAPRLSPRPNDCRKSCLTSGGEGVRGTLLHGLAADWREPFSVRQLMSGGVNCIDREPWQEFNYAPPTPWTLNIPDDKK